MSIIRLGITRTLVSDVDGAVVTQQCQRSGDVWEIEVPEDGSEFLSSIWMDADGMEVLRLPLSMGPAMTRITSATDG